MFNLLNEIKTLIKLHENYIEKNEWILNKILFYHIGLMYNLADQISEEVAEIMDEQS